MEIDEVLQRESATQVENPEKVKLNKKEMTLNKTESYGKDLLARQSELHGLRCLKASFDITIPSMGQDLRHSSIAR